MAVDLQVQLFDAFLGTAEGIHSVILPDIFSSGGSLNLWIDKYGRAKKVDGYAKANATAVTTDTGASATLCRGLFPYRSSSGGSFTRRLLGVFDDETNEYEVHVSTDDGATFTFVQDLGAGSIGSIPDFQQLGNTLIFTNGVVAPRMYDGTTWSTAGSTQLAAPTSVAGNSGNLTGHYNWKIVPIDGSGTSNTRKVASAKSTELNVDTKRVTVSWTADTDVNVVGYELYRTTGTGAVFYFVDYIDGRLTVSYDDNIGDLLILENRVMEEHGDAPPSGAYFVESHKQRMWYLRTDTNPRRAYWSDPGDPDGVWSENYIDFSDGRTMGDVITSAAGGYEGRLVIFTELAIWTVSGTGAIVGNLFDWSRTRTNAQTGACARRVVARIPAGAKFADQNGEIKVLDAVSLAYLTPLGDIRVFDGDNDTIISHPMKVTLDGLNYAQRRKAFCIHDTDRSEVAWVLPTASSAEPNTCVVWNYRWGVWYERSWAFACGLEIETSTDGSVLVAGSNSTTTGGRVYTLWSGNSNDGSAIEATWMTKTLYGVLEKAQPAVAHTKRWRWADFLFETDQSVTLTVSWLAGNTPNNAAAVGTATFQPGAASILSAGGDTLVSAGGDTLLVSAASAQAKVLLHTSTGDYLHHEGIRLKVGDNASLGSWSLEAMELAYQILPGLRRRMQS